MLRVIKWFWFEANCWSAKSQQRIISKICPKLSWVWPVGLVLIVDRQPGSWSSWEFFANLFTTPTQLLLTKLANLPKVNLADFSRYVGLDKGRRQTLGDPSASPTTTIKVVCHLPELMCSNIEFKTKSSEIDSNDSFIILWVIDWLLINVLISLHKGVLSILHDQSTSQIVF